MKCPDGRQLTIDVDVVISVGVGVITMSVSVGWALKLATRSFANKAPSSMGRLKVALLGAAGRTGQPLAMLLKNSPQIDELLLYDIVNTKSLSVELSQIDTRCSVTSCRNRISEALDNAQIVVIVACAPCISDSDFDTQFQPNASIVFELMSAVARYCPKALVAIATEPINSMIPVACEVMKRFRAYDPAKIFGVTTIDVMRANALAARISGLAPEQVNVPVIGGHSDKTIIPVLSHIQPPAAFSDQELVDITDGVQTASENLVKMKRGSTLSMSAAFAVARFVVSLARAVRGERGVLECAYVRSDLYSNIRYLATPLELGANGVQRNIGLPPLSEYEECQLQNASVLLRGDIKAGERFVSGKSNKYCQPPPTCDPSSTPIPSSMDLCNPCT